MKKVIFLLIAFAITISSLTAQNHDKPNRYFTKGQSDIQIGLGLLPADVIIDKAITKTMPYTVELNRMMRPKFSLGLFYVRSVMESQPKINNGIAEQIIEKDFRQTGLKLAFHFCQIKNFDSYGGFALAINKHLFKVVEGDEEYLIEHKNFQPKRVGIGYTGFVGGRLAVKKDWLVFAEIGYGGTSLLTCGIGYQL